MARLSKEERAELEARLAEDDQDDDDDEVEVGFGDGSYVKGKFRRVQDAAAARGFKLRPDPSPEKDETPAKGSNVKRFNAGRRTG